MELLLKYITTYGFPIVLSVYLMIKLDYFINAIIKTNKEFVNLLSTEVEKMTKALLDLQMDLAKK